MTTLIILFILSISFNVILYWYMRETTENLMAMVNSMAHLTNIFSDFKKHVGALKEMELFYGDQNLINLFNHIDFIVEELKEFEELIEMSDEDEIYDYDDSTEEEEEAQEEKKESLLYKVS